MEELLYLNQLFRLNRSNKIAPVLVCQIDHTLGELI